MREVAMTTDSDLSHGDQSPMSNPDGDRNSPVLLRLTDLLGEFAQDAQRRNEGSDNHWTDSYAKEPFNLKPITNDRFR
jgi:hypothetical protein